VLPRQLRGGRLFHIGRLDRDSTGLLLLGGDGDLAQRLLHPRRPIWKRYRLRIDMELAPQDLQLIRRGEIELDGKPCAPARIRRSGGALGRSEYEIELREGRNRQIRRMFELFGIRVLSLHRLAFGPIELSGLQVGGWRELTAREAEALRDAAGLVDDAAHSG
jgi:23S rRNA pseudouridine2605 synthase